MITSAYTKKSDSVFCQFPFLYVDDSVGKYCSCFLETMIRSRCHRPQRKSDSIEYHVSSSQISFLLTPPSSFKSVTDALTKSLHPTLFTFPASATLKLILSQENFINTVIKYLAISEATTDEHTAHFELEGKILDENMQFSSIFLIKALVLVIDNNIQSKFHRSKHLSPNSSILNEHRKGLFHRLPIENGLRPKSDKQYVYPNESLDLLFDTLRGQLSYLTEYLKSHLGDRHEFTIYPIQQQKESNRNRWYEWETGIYKMRGDRDGTVNIALASDWYVSMCISHYLLILLFS